MNDKQKAWLSNFLSQCEMTFKGEKEWADVKAIHSSDIEFIYQELKKLE